MGSETVEQYAISTRGNESLTQGMPYSISRGDYSQPQMYNQMSVRYRTF